MATTKKDEEKVEFQRQNGNSEASSPVHVPAKADPPAGRKRSRAEALDYAFEKNEELLRRLA